MQVILLLAGLILLLAVTAPWAATVGWICLGVFAVITLLQVLAVIGVRKAQKRMQREFHSRRSFL
jgi:membrane protein implicated in regulation of membrane protease activity